MNCKKIHQSLIFYLDGELPGHEHTAFESHLKDCPKCAAFLLEMKSVMGIIEMEKKVESNPFLFARIEEQLKSREEKQSVPVFAPLWKKVLQPAAVTFLIALGIFIGTSLGTALQNPNDNSLNGFDEEIAYFDEMKQENIETFLLENE